MSHVLEMPVPQHGYTARLELPESWYASGDYMAPQRFNIESNYGEDYDVVCLNPTPVSDGRKYAIGFRTKRASFQISHTSDNYKPKANWHACNRHYHFTSTGDVLPGETETTVTFERILAKLEQFDGHPVHPRTQKHLFSELRELIKRRNAAVKS